MLQHEKKSNKNPVLDSAWLVASKSKHVKINSIKIKEFAKMFDRKSLKHWMEKSPFNLSGLNNDEKLAFLFTFNSISFSYFGDPKWISVHLGENGERGTWSLFVALRKARDEGALSLAPLDLMAIDKEKFSYILRGKEDVEIPLLEKRLEILREVGETVCRYHDSNFGNVVNSANRDALALLDIIVNEFPSFNDSASFEVEKIKFHKRAQLLISDIYNVFEGKDYGKLENIGKLTVCADYILPMVLRHIGILEYSLELSGRVDKKILIPAGTAEEIEIRANTIIAVEMIKEKLNPKFPDITSMMLNDYFWLEGNNVPLQIPHHLTETTFY